MRDFFQEIFYLFSAAGLIFIALEVFWPGLVLAYFNLNWLLPFWLTAGIMVLFLKK